ncbi:hypothetical protein N657DRAFT_265961 [Parathielavia appendiculata]|uniref:Uncharacterized protein n=1 Tax=Parathielavia appendiculata TaxID=2587402 RepID=A0AAN6U2Z6_9PEZI|nr:hypothetical protein N657DRAFT_265961 [Parathielavia appendiculata]
MPYTGNSLRGKLLSRPASEDYPASPKHIGLANIWMDRRRKHSRCNDARASVALPLPKRVLDIQTTHRLSVRAAAGRVRSARNSAIAGRGRAHRTTTEILAHHHAGIPLSTFPLTSGSPSRWQAARESATSVLTHSVSSRMITWTGPTRRLR